MLHEENTIRLRHMLDAAREALDHAEGRSRDDLESDRQLVHSLVHCLEIIGEAASKVSHETREEIPAIPWTRMVGMRNRLIHAYYDVNLKIVWRTVREELPELIEAIEAALGGSEQGPDSSSPL